MRIEPTLAVLILTLALNAPCAEPDQSSVRRAATWRPLAQFDPTAQTLKFVDGLIDRRLPTLANEELARIDLDSLETTSPENAAAYGCVAIRVILENARLASKENRAQTEEALAALRERFPNEALGQNSSDAVVAYELAYVRALFDLAVLADAQKNGAGDGEQDPDAVRLYRMSSETAFAAAEKLKGPEAVPFLYWRVAALVAIREQSDSDQTAQALVQALDKNRDVDYFYARLLLVRSARLRKDNQLASDRIAETLDALKSVKSADGPQEIALGLVCEEARLLFDDGKTVETLQTLGQEVDLLGAPLPENRERFTDRYPDLFAEYALTRAELFWLISQEVENETQDDAISNLPKREALVSAATNETGNLKRNVDRARAGLLAGAVGSVSSDWKTLEAAAEEQFRNGEWQASYDGYDRAAQEADAANDSDSAYRLRGICVAIANKICSEKLFDETDEKNPNVWLETTSKRLLELAKERPEEKNAPDYYRVAIARAKESGKKQDELNAMRQEFLELFPNADGSGIVALSTAQTALAANDLDGAARALDAIAATNESFEESLKLEWELYLSKQERDGLERAFANELARLLDKTTFAANSPGDDLSSVAERLNESATRLSKSSLTPGDSAILNFMFEKLVLSNDLYRSTPELSTAYDAALKSWALAAKDDRAATEKIRSYRLAFTLYAKTTDDVLKLLSSGGGKTAASLESLEQIRDLAEPAPTDSKRKFASFLLDAIKSLSTSEASSPRVQLLKADALRLAGQAQEALNSYAALRKLKTKNRGFDIGIAKGLALVLSEQKSEKALKKALEFWSDYADLVGEGAPEWWDAKENCVAIYCKLGNVEHAKKMLNTLWLTRDDPTDMKRKERWQKIISDAERGSKP